MEGYVSTGYDSVVSYGLDCDFTMLITKKMPPEAIAERYGETGEIKTEKLGDILVTNYVYDTLTVNFTERDGKLEAAGLLITSPEAPIAVGGFQAGSSLDHANNSLRANGYKEKEALSTDMEKYYSGKSLEGDTCLIVLHLKNNIVNKAQGWYGELADEIMELSSKQ